MDEKNSLFKFCRNNAFEPLSAYVRNGNWICLDLHSAEVEAAIRRIERTDSSDTARIRKSARQCLGAPLFSQQMSAEVQEQVLMVSNQAESPAVYPVVSARWLIEVARLDLLGKTPSWANSIDIGIRLLEHVDVLQAGAKLCTSIAISAACIESESVHEKTIWTSIAALCWDLYARDLSSCDNPVAATSMRVIRSVHGSDELYGSYLRRLAAINLSWQAE